MDRRLDWEMSHLPEHSAAARLWLDEAGRRYTSRPRGAPYLPGIGADSIFSAITDPLLEQVKVAAAEGAEEQVAPHIRNLYLLSAASLLVGGAALAFALLNRAR